MNEMPSFKAIAGAHAKAYDSGFSATCNSLSELKRKLSLYKDASDTLAKIPVVDSTQGPTLQCSYEYFLSVKSALDSAKLGVVRSAQDVRQHYPYEYWSMKSALDYAGGVASSRPRRKWYGARRNVRSAVIVESGHAQVMVIEGKRRDVVSTSGYPSGGEMKFMHQHFPEGEIQPYTHLNYTEWVLAAGTVSAAFFAYELMFAKGSLDENMVTSGAVAAALLVAVPAISMVMDILPRKAKKPRDTEQVLEPQQFLAEAGAMCADIEVALASMEREIGSVLVQP
jgi:hypothetical protein